MSAHDETLSAGAEHTLRRVVEGWSLISGYRERGGRTDTGTCNLLISPDGTTEKVNIKSINALVAKRLVLRHGYPIGRYKLTERGRIRAQIEVRS